MPAVTTTSGPGTETTGPLVEGLAVWIDILGALPSKKNRSHRSVCAPRWYARVVAWSACRCNAGRKHRPITRRPGTYRSLHLHRPESHQACMAGVFTTLVSRRPRNRRSTAVWFGPRSSTRSADVGARLCGQAHRRFDALPSKDGLDAFRAPSPPLTEAFDAGNVPAETTDCLGPPDRRPHSASANGASSADRRPTPLPPRSPSDHRR
jgi:hypothetical protein